jgi:DNA-binding XRE family transcriptional regulator
MQDWKPVTLHKMGPKQSKQVKPIPPAVNPEVKRTRMLDSSNDGTGPKIEKVSAEDRKEIMQLRLLRKITQSDLDKQLSLKKDTIKLIENGTYEKNKMLTNKIKEFLKKV